MLLDFRAVKRRIHIKDDGQQVHENDAEHSYSLAMAAWYLSAYFPELDSNQIIKYALAHDLVEVHAGDTYAFADDTALNAKADKERRAAERLKNEWSDFVEIHEMIAAYEDRASPEAKFVYALDKIMPMLLNLLNDGYTWHKEHLTYQRLYDNKIAKIAVSPELEPYGKALFELMADHPELLPQ